MIFVLMMISMLTNPLQTHSTSTLSFSCMWHSRIRWERCHHDDDRDHEDDGNKDVYDTCDDHNDHYGDDDLDDQLQVILSLSQHCVSEPQVTITFTKIF